MFVLNVLLLVFKILPCEFFFFFFFKLSKDFY